MRKTILPALLFAVFAQFTYAQTDTISSYIKKTYRIPMRDGVKLFTVVFSPARKTTPLPILIQRTPYGADKPVKEDSSWATDQMPPQYRAMAKSGYILVFQDIRGKFQSEGLFEMNKALYHVADQTKTDESTDAYDAIDWLIKNIPGNNGKAGIFGVSYLGFTALNAVSDPHPALKASSPQASPVDMFYGDDFHHNGAFRLSYGMEYAYEVEYDKTTDSQFPFPQFDVFNWYLKLGSLKNVNGRYFHDSIVAWNNFTNHPNYDAYWKKQSLLNKILYPEIPVLHVGGYYDQEDLNGPQIKYNQMELKDSFNRNFLVLGPWNHGQWARPKADSLGEMSFGSQTAVWFQGFQKQWFDYWLKGIGDGKFAEVNSFQTGSNQWKTYSQWPPKEATIQKLYTHADGTCDFTKPVAGIGSVTYISDPAKPIPYRKQPIEATYGRGSRWNAWQVEDQRFAATRPDVIIFSADSLKNDLTITGTVKAHIFVSTTGGDADFVVKLIDVYPDFDQKSLSMSGYEFPVTMEVFRGRFRKSFEKPEPFVPGKPEEIVIDLHQVNHSFQKGHHLMIQVQSSWFPLIDRNPQKYVPDIFQAKETDFIKASHTLYCNKQFSSYLELPVITKD